MNTSMSSDNTYNKKKGKKMKSCKLYCNIPEIHSGNLILAKKKSSKSANVSDTLSPIGKLLAQTSTSSGVQPLHKSR